MSLNYDCRCDFNLCRLISDSQLRASQILILVWISVHFMNVNVAWLSMNDMKCFIRSIGHICTRGASSQLHVSHDFAVVPYLQQ